MSLYAVLEPVVDIPSVKDVLVITDFEGQNIGEDSEESSEESQESQESRVSGRFSAILAAGGR